MFLSSFAFGFLGQLSSRLILPACFITTTTIIVIVINMIVLLLFLLLLLLLLLLLSLLLLFVYIFSLFPFAAFQLTATLTEKHQLSKFEQKM